MKWLTVEQAEQQLGFRCGGFHQESDSELGELIVYYTLEEGPECSDQVLEIVKRVRGLNAVSINSDYEGDFTAAAIPHLAEIPELKKLFIDRTAITNESLAGLKDCQQLQQLEMACEWIDRSGLENLAQISSLQNLRIWRTKKINPEDLEALARMKQLRRVSIQTSDRLSDEHLSSFSTLTKLQELTLATSSLTGDGLDALLPLVELEFLRIGDDGDYDGANLSVLKALPKLHKLSVGSNHLNGEKLAALAELPKLRTLQIAGTSIDDGDIEHIAKLQQLEKLRIHGTRISEEGKRRLRELMPRITFLDRDVD